jgi:hypothetical protein
VEDEVARRDKVRREERREEKRREQNRTEQNRTEQKKGIKMEMEMDRLENCLLCAISRRTVVATSRLLIIVADGMTW